MVNFKISFLAVLYLFISLQQLMGQEHFEPLTKKQKLEDFQYLHEELKAAYPYFDVNKRLFGIDWLANKKEYRSLIKKATSDSAFYQTLAYILNDLNNGHTDMYPNLYYDYFYTAYKEAVEGYPAIQPYVDELEKTSQERCAYWNRITKINDLESQESDIPNEDASAEASNILIEFDNSNSVAVLQIKSFSYEYIDTDAAVLSDFFEKAHQYDHLLIDIRGNIGGDDHYWQELLVAFLIEKPIDYPIVFAYKDSERFITFKQPEQDIRDFSALQDEIKRQSNVDFNFSNMPEELKSGQYSFTTYFNTVEPNQSGKKYDGQIYLLVDGLVYSSAESFAYFCKATRFAKVIGEKTGGDGIGTDPLILTLPNSGIVIRFTGEMALNSDGSSNEEMKTMPDIYIQDVNEYTKNKAFYKYMGISLE
ncbi:MAG: S41 family peptidase [Chitinophagales bacterium]|nr:S41 family peptidase [Chitinophagales bacterium]